MVGLLGTVSKSLEKELKELEICVKIETIQTTWERLKCWEEFWRSGVTYCQSDSRENSPANASVKISQGVKIWKQFYT